MNEEKLNYITRPLISSSKIIMFGKSAMFLVSLEVSVYCLLIGSSVLVLS